MVAPGGRQHCRLPRRPIHLLHPRPTDCRTCGASLDAIAPVVRSAWASRVIRSSRDREGEVSVEAELADLFAACVADEECRLEDEEGEGVDAEEEEEEEEEEKEEEEEEEEAGAGSGARSAGSTSCTTAQHVRAMACGAAACGTCVGGGREEGACSRAGQQGRLVPCPTGMGCTLCMALTRHSPRAWTPTSHPMQSNSKAQHLLTSVVRRRLPPKRHLPQQLRCAHTGLRLLPPAFAAVDPLLLRPPPCMCSRRLHQPKLRPQERTAARTLCTIAFLQASQSVQYHPFAPGPWPGLSQ